MLRHLNHEILKFDIGMWNHIHRHVLMKVIQKLFRLNNHQMKNPTRLSDFRRMHIRYVQRQKASNSQITRNHCTNEDEQYTLQHLNADKDGSLGMSLSSVLHNTTKYGSSESYSSVEVSASKSPRSRISMASSLVVSKYRDL